MRIIRSVTYTGTGIRVLSLFASVAVHAAVLMSIPAPVGESATGPAEISTTLHLSVQHSEPTDLAPRVEPDQNRSELRSEQRETIATTPRRSLQQPAPVVAELKVNAAQLIAPGKPKLKTTPAPRLSSSGASAPSRRGAKSSVKQPMQIAASGQSARLSRDYRSTLLRLIERHKYYPLRARRAGLEGTATVAFTVSSNGEINGVSLAQSSGMSLLDQAAIQTIRRVDKAPPFPSGIERSKWRFVIPLAYNIR